jgi:two-component system, CitB family, response regulator
MNHKFMSIRLVIAEDDAQIAEIQRRFVERMDGFEVVGIAHALDEARDLVEVLTPELLLLDVQFPGGSGLELLRELRAGNCGTDVILITAATEVNTLQEALRGGVFDYILKPLVFDRMQESLRNYASHQSKLRALRSLEQQDVDGLLPRTAPRTGAKPAGPLPKGIDALTLDKVREVMAHPEATYSAEEMGEKIGASRTTTRRYLEYLVSCGEILADVDYGTVGRPARRYRRIAQA